MLGLNDTFTWLFVVEMMLKLVVYGFKECMLVYVCVWIGWDSMHAWLQRNHNPYCITPATSMHAWLQGMRGVPSNPLTPNHYTAQNMYAVGVI